MTITGIFTFIAIEKLLGRDYALCIFYIQLLVGVQYYVHVYRSKHGLQHNILNGITAIIKIKKMHHRYAFQSAHGNRITWV